MEGMTDKQKIQYYDDESGDEIDEDATKRVGEYIDEIQAREVSKDPNDVKKNLKND